MRISILVIVLFCVSHVFGDSLWSDNGSDHLWTNSQNWDGGQLPTCTTDVAIQIFSPKEGPATEQGDAVCCRAFKFKDGTMTMNGGTLTVDSWGGAGSWGGGSATLILNGDSSLNFSADSFQIGFSQQGLLVLNDNSNVTISNTLFIAKTDGITPGIGHLQLNGGEIEANWLDLGNDGVNRFGTIDITGGKLVINTDMVSAIQQYVDANFITAYGGDSSAEVQVDFISGKTVVTASSVGGFSGDFNFDFRIDFLDFAKFAYVWLDSVMPGNENAVYDFNNDGLIDIHDQKVLSENWLETKTVETQIQVDIANIQHDVSPFLTGSCINTNHDSDSRWSDGSIATRLVEMDAGILRWPDTAAMYHWLECPGAPTWKDSWEADPGSSYYFADHTVCDDTYTMDVDEYISWCTTVGAEPYITVNFQSGWRYNRLNDSLAESVALVQHCKDNSYNVKYWRIGNEPFDMTGTQMSSVVNLFVPAMKAVDPNIKIIFNASNHFSTDYAQGQWDSFFAGLDDPNYVDYADLHWYWRWTDADDPSEWKATWDNFINDVPMTVEYKSWTNNITFDQEVKNFRQRYGSYIEDVMITEWNAGPLRGLLPRSHYQAAMMQCEMMMQFIKSDLFAATRWPGSWASAQGDRAYIDPTTLEPRPVQAAMQLFSEALGHNMVSSVSSELTVPSVSILSSDGKELWVYVLNKTSFDKPTEINTGASNIINIETVSLCAPANNVWGDDFVLNNQQTGYRQGNVYITAPSYSLTKVKISFSGL